MQGPDRSKISSNFDVLRLSSARLFSTKLFKTLHDQPQLALFMSDWIFELGWYVFLGTRFFFRWWVDSFSAYRQVNTFLRQTVLFAWFSFYYGPYRRFGHFMPRLWGCLISLCTKVLLEVTFCTKIPDRVIKQCSRVKVFNVVWPGFRNLILHKMWNRDGC